MSPRPRPEHQASALPRLYARWVADFMSEPVLHEPRSTCSDCSMLPREEEPSTEQEVTFDPRTKCCTFMPDLPNYLVGSALGDLGPDTAEGRATVVERIHSRAAVTPLGLGRTARFARDYRDNPSWFGRNIGLKCPHYLPDGRCGIWKYRESTCATWFCKHERGVVSKLSWRALQRVLSAIEHEVAYWCVQELGADNEVVRRIYEESTPPIEDPSASLDTEHRAAWGEWFGREEEFYRRAAELVEPMSYLEAAHIAGPGIADLLIDLGEASAELDSHELPERICSGDVDVVRIGQTSARVKAYNEFDTRDVPRALVAALPELDGLTVDEARRVLQVRHDLRLTTEDIRLLLDLQILLPYEPI